MIPGKCQKNALARCKTPSRTPAKFELWVTGTVPPLARRQLKVRGIKVVENANRRIGMVD